MEAQKKKLGRPKGKAPPLTSAMRMAVTRKRRAIVLEEHEKLGLTIKRFAFDDQIFSDFEDFARDCGRQVDVEGLVFAAMTQYLNSTKERLNEPELNVDKHSDDELVAPMFQLAKIQSLIRFEEEGLATDRVKQVLNVHGQPDEI